MDFLKNNKLLYIIFGLLLGIQIFQLLFFNRAIFLSRYDPHYWKDRIEHSQWVLPLSTRIIGDDGLFAYVGYTLIHGADPTWLNVETGPTGKYLLGFSILLFRNPSIIPFILVIASSILLFSISKKILHDTSVSLFVSLLFLSDPIVVAESAASTIDIIQVFFLLLFLFSWIASVSDKNYRSYWTFSAGISLGLFATVKLPILMPILLIGIVAWLIKKNYIRECIVFIVALCIGFILPYIQYFHFHHSFADFMKLQKYIASFYLKSHLTVHHLAIWQIIFAKQFPDIVSGYVATISEWSIVWPLGIVASLCIGIWIFFQKRKDFWLVALFIYVVSSIFVFTLIPVYPRYLLLVVPAIYILVGKILIGIPKNTYKISLLLVFSIVLIYLSNNMLQPSYEVVLNDFTYNLSHSFFQDIYQEDIGNAKDLHMSRQQFQVLSQKAFFDAQIESLTFKRLSQEGKGNDLFVHAMLTYTTRHLGNFTENKIIHMQVMEGSWKVVWEWNDLMDHFQPGDLFMTTVIPGKRGDVIDTNGNMLAKDTEGFLISIKPSAMDTKKENAMLTIFSKLSGVKAVHLQNGYLENPPQDTYIPLFTTFQPVDASTAALLTSFPGIKLEPAQARIYTYPSDSLLIANTTYNECCTRLYSSSIYHGIAGWEKVYDSRLSGFDGGSLVLKNVSGKLIQTKVERKPKDGENIICPTYFPGRQPRAVVNSSIF